MICKVCFNFFFEFFRRASPVVILEAVQPTSHGMECSDQCKTHQVKNLKEKSICTAVAIIRDLQTRPNKLKLS